MAYEYIPETPATPAFGRTWIVQAAWAHPVWHSYVFMLYDLTTYIPDQPAPAIYRPGMTHEFMVFALDPAFPSVPPSHLLQPANMGYQFAATSDDEASGRIMSLIADVEAMRLSPDTDWRFMWDEHFADGERLHNRPESRSGLSGATVL